MTNVNATVVEAAPNGGSTNAGWKVGFLDSPAKAAQNDTVTITNAAQVIWAGLTNDEDGSSENLTIGSNNVLTLKTASIGHVSGLVLYR